MGLFGWLSGSKKNIKPTTAVPVSPTPNDGSYVINSNNLSGYWGYNFDIDAAVTDDFDMILKYRDTASFPTADEAIEQIVDEMVIVDSEKPVAINLDNLPKQYNGIKKKVEAEWTKILDLYNFNRDCHDIIKRWYIDGKIYYYLTIDPSSPKKGIQEIRYIDPRKIKKVVELEKEQKDGVEIIKGSKEYYLFNDKGLANADKGVRLSPDCVVDVPSGLVDATSGKVISYLYKAIKPVNQLKMMEDALVIYRITRAPERRLFYIDVGNMPAQKAEQYVSNIMNKFRNRVQYDAKTGEIKNGRNYLSMMEDFFLPRREGGRSTEVQTLAGGCLAMDTKVSLLDGRELSIREISEEINEGKQLWTYSCNPMTGAVTAGKISWAGVTHKEAEVMKITLDNGESVICTPDHKFPIIGRGFVRADELRENDSLTPLYRRKEAINTGKKRKHLKYEQIFDNAEKEWKFTHRVVADVVSEKFRGSVIHHKDFNRFNNNPENLVRLSWNDHIKLHNEAWERVLLRRYNDIVANSGVEGWRKECSKIYWEWFNSLSEKEKKEYYNKWDYYSCLSELEKEEHKNRFRKTLEKWKNSLSKTDKEILRQKQHESILNFFESMDDEERENWAAHCRKNIEIASRVLSEKLKDKDFHEHYCKLHSDCWNDDMRLQRSKEASKWNRNYWNNPDREEERKTRRLKHKETQKLVINEKIAKFVVDICKGKTTHQFTVDDVIFALNSNSDMVETLQKLNEGKHIPNWVGFFTPNIIKKEIHKFYGFKSWHDFRKNCALINHRIISIEKLPQKIEVGTLRIDDFNEIHDYHTFALSCGVFTKNSNLSEIEDIVYFQSKLYQSLGVPRQRLSGEQNNFQIGKSDNINRDEIIFAKMIHRLRNCFAKFFLIPLKAQLIAKKIITEKDWLIIENKILFDYAKDNYFEEIKEQELLTDRINLLGQIDGYKGTYFSTDWIVRNVLNMTDEEWKAMKKEMKADGDEPKDNNSDSHDSYSHDDGGYSFDSGYNDNDSESNSDDSEEEDKEKPKAKLLDSRRELKKPRGRIGRYVGKLSEDE